VTAAGLDLPDKKRSPWDDEEVITRRLPVPESVHSVFAAQPVAATMADHLAALYALGNLSASDRACAALATLNAHPAPHSGWLADRLVHWFLRGNARMRECVAQLLVFAA